LYDDAWGRVRNWNGMPSGFGVNPDDARRWNRRAYGNSQGEIDHMQPEEIGYAAAYQAYRSWLKHGSMYDLLGDPERQREGLVGIAVAEVTRLLQYSTRPLDRYSRSLAAEAAAQTVTSLFYQGRDEHPGARMRAASFSGSMMPDPIDMMSRRSRSRSRSHYRHSSSPSPRRYRHRSRSRMYDEYSDAGPIPGGIPYAASYGGHPSSYNEPYNSGNWPISSTPSAQPMPMYSSPYPAQQLGSPYPPPPGIALSSSYPGNMAYSGQPMMSTPMHSPVGYGGVPPYGGVPYGGQAPYGGAPYGVPSQAPSVVIVKSKKHRHRY